ncbi:hypothetical protein [Campylobacter concisus]|nr:hypothetical protein [Campylobacter concisus]
MGWLLCNKEISIKVGIASVVTGMGQAVADSIKSKNDKDKKDNKK